MMRKAAAAILLLLGLLAAAVPALAADYAVGQVWSYKTRPGEEGSKLYIVRIDRELASEPIFHIYVDGLQLKNPLMEGGIQKNLPHAPVTQKALDGSVVELLESDALLPNIAEGYSMWRLAFGRGQAGVFNVPVDQIIGIIEEAFNKPRTPQGN